MQSSETNQQGHSQAEAVAEHLAAKNWDRIASDLERPDADPEERDATLMRISEAVLRDTEGQLVTGLREYVDRIERTSGQPVLGKGDQYVVYDEGNGRVWKMPKTPAQRILDYIDAGVVDAENIQEDMARVDGLTRKSLEGLRQVPDLSSIEELGHPELYPSGGYRQDFAPPLGPYLEKATPEEVHQLLQEYAEAVVSLWRHHIADTTFNLTINYGRTEDGKVVLNDIGELTFSKEDIEKAISTRAWTRSASYAQLPEEYRQYFGKIMEDTLTIGTLETTWEGEEPPPLP